MTNWPDYNTALRRRGDATIRLEDGAAGKWSAPTRKDRGGQPKYSDFSIAICLTLWPIFHLPLRQTQGFVRSLLKLMAVDSTGLKIHHGSGWQEEKQGTGRTRKSWRELHIGYDPDSGETALNWNAIGEQAHN